MSCVIQMVFDEDSTNTVLGRLQAIGGSGNATGVSGEANWLQQSDFSSITRNVYDLDSATPTTPVDTETLTVSTVINDTPQTLGWTVDETGYNFIDNIGTDVIDTGGHDYKAEYLGTLTDGKVFVWFAIGTCRGIDQS